MYELDNEFPDGIIMHPSKSDMSIEVDVVASQPAGLKQEAGKSVPKEEVASRMVVEDGAKIFSRGFGSSDTESARQNFSPFGRVIDIKNPGKGFVIVSFTKKSEADKAIRLVIFFLFFFIA